VDVGASFGTQTEPLHLVQPTYGPFNDPTGFAQPAAVFGIPSGGDRFNAPLMEHGTVMLRVVRSVALTSLRPAAWFSRLAAHGGDRIYQRDHLGDIVLVGTSQRGRERKAVGVVSR